MHSSLKQEISNDCVVMVGISFQAGESRKEPFEKHPSMCIIVAASVENSMSLKQAISASDIINSITNKAEAETASALYMIGLNCT